MVQTHRPKMVFIAETRQNQFSVQSMKLRLGLRRCFIVDGCGKGGGLALFWDESINVDLKSYNMRHIDSVITENNGEQWRATLVYGEPKAQDRHMMWTLLRRIKCNSHLPWMMIGDFGETNGGI